MDSCVWLLFPNVFLKFIQLVVLCTSRAQDVTNGNDSVTAGANVSPVGLQTRYPLKPGRVALSALPGTSLCSVRPVPLFPEPPRRPGAPPRWPRGRHPGSLL